METGVCQGPNPYMCGCLRLRHWGEKAECGCGRTGEVEAGGESVVPTRSRIEVKRGHLSGG